MEEKNKQKIIIYTIILLTFLAGLFLLFVAIKYLLTNYFLASLFFSISGGAIGGALYMGRGFYYSVAETEIEERKFNFERWIWWYLLRPIFSVVAGALLFLVVYTALNLQETQQNQVVFFIIGVLAGYDFHDFAENKLGFLSKATLTKKQFSK